VIEDFSEHIQSIIKSLPETPGVYQYYDKENTLLYVGKAKSLKKRVSSYFTKEHDNARFRLLVKKISDIKTVKVNTELDALLLETNLIKNLKPRYNVNLRDDKTYPWIIIKNERFPRIFYTRKQIKDGSEYFGPYPSVLVMHALLDLIKQLFPLRTCSYDLSEQNIAKKKFRVCLDYHIGKCKGPCEGKQSFEEYDNNMKQIRKIIKGDFAFALKDLKAEMQTFSDNLEFEKAEELKQKIDLLEKYQGKSTIVHPSVTDTDVFAAIHEESISYVSYFKIYNGAIVQAQILEL